MVAFLNNKKYRVREVIPIRPLKGVTNFTVWYGHRNHPFKWLRVYKDKKGCYLRESGTRIYLKLYKRGKND